MARMQRGYWYVGASRMCHVCKTPKPWDACLPGYGSVTRADKACLPGLPRKVSASQWTIATNAATWTALPRLPLSQGATVQLDRVLPQARAKAINGSEA